MSLKKIIKKTGWFPSHSNTVFNCNKLICTQSTKQPTFLWSFTLYFPVRWGKDCCSHLCTHVWAKGSGGLYFSPVFLRGNQVQAVAFAIVLYNSCKMELGKRRASHKEGHHLDLHLISIELEEHNITGPILDPTELGCDSSNGSCGSTKGAVLAPRTCDSPRALWLAWPLWHAAAMAVRGQKTLHFRGRLKTDPCGGGRREAVGCDRLWESLTEYVSHHCCVKVGYAYFAGFYGVTKLKKKRDLMLLSTKTHWKYIWWDITLTDCSIQQMYIYVLTTMNI